MTIVKAHGNNCYILDGQCIIQMALTYVTFIQIWMVMDRSYIHSNLDGESHSIRDGINNCYSGW